MGIEIHITNPSENCYSLMTVPTNGEGDLLKAVFPRGYPEITYQIDGSPGSICIRCTPKNDEGYDKQYPINILSCRDCPKKIMGQDMILFLNKIYSLLIDEHSNILVNDLVSIVDETPEKIAANWRLNEAYSLWKDVSPPY
ncbi:hypothetical protein JW711_02405 [Candidatus Woesearchaeota archaeon]|nr:hypothetical protein [Candidatus Woesearchaeota archaeon]